MAWVTHAANVANAQMRFRVDVQGIAVRPARWRATGANDYTALFPMTGGVSVSRGSTTLGSAPSGSVAVGDIVEVKMVGAEITVTNLTRSLPLLTITNSKNASGRWDTEDSYLTLTEFINLDAPSGFAVDISAGSGGSVAPAQLTDVDDTTGKTFTVTPNAGYRIASITPSTGVTVTPAASGQTGATEFTVKATQAGSVSVAFEIIPAPPHTHNALMMGAGF